MFEKVTRAKIELLIGKINLSIIALSLNPIVEYFCKYIFPGVSTTVIPGLLDNPRFRKIDNKIHR